MRKKEKQMSIGQDIKSQSSTSYLLFFKNMFKKISKPLIIMILLFFFNVGSKYPVIAKTEINSLESKTQIYDLEQKIGVLEDEYKKYVELYQKIYERSLIQQIEFESEVIIPEYFDFKYVEYTYETSKKLEIDPRIAFRLIFKESRFDHTAKSTAGAEGIMQLMPNTRKKYYDDLRIDTLNLDKVQEDIYIGLYYIKDLKEFWRERGNTEKNLTKLSIASYNAGQGAVIKYHGIPPYKETQDFVSFILKPHSNPTFYANILKRGSLTDIS